MEAAWRRHDVDVAGGGLDHVEAGHRAQEVSVVLGGARFDRVRGDHRDGGGGVDELRLRLRRAHHHDFLAQLDRLVLGLGARRRLWRLGQHWRRPEAEAQQDSEIPLHEKSSLVEDPPAPDEGRRRGRRGVARGMRTSRIRHHRPGQASSLCSRGKMMRFLTTARASVPAASRESRAPSAWSSLSWRPPKPPLERTTTRSPASSSAASRSTISVDRRDELGAECPRAELPRRAPLRRGAGLPGPCRGGGRRPRSRGRRPRRHARSPAGKHVSARCRSGVRRRQ